MADFLSRLAARSLGQAPLARPVIAPLFATGPDLGAEGVAPADEASDTASAVPFAAPDAAASTLPPKRPEPPGRELVGKVSAARTGRIVETHSPAEPGSHAARSIERARSGPRPRRVDPAPIGTPAAVRPVTLARPVLNDRELALPRPQIASLSPEVEPSAPIVRVFIGRVDVRAVAPPPDPARPAPARVEDRLPLGEYLRGETRRR